MEQDIGQILTGFVSARSNEEKEQYEQRIRDLKENDPKLFLYEMVKQLNNEELADGARHLTGILFKNTAKAGEETPFWFVLTDEEREQLKEGILNPLASKNRQVRLSACSCVAAVACLELPKGQWGEIITNLCSNSAAENDEVRGSSLTTLGYICEEIDGETLGDDHTNLVISALLESLSNNSEDAELMKTTMQAIYHSIEFAENIFSQGKGDVIIERVIQHGTNADEDVRKKVMMSIAEIIRCYYSDVDSHMDAISQLTLQIVSEDPDEEVATLAIEIWCTVCEGEIEIYKRKKGEGCRDYIRKASGPLIEMVLKCIAESEVYEDDESDSWNKSTASGCCLSLMAQILGDDIIEPVTVFAGQKITNSTEWKDKYLGLLALGAILEGPTKEKLKEVVGPAMGQIIELYKNESRKVRETVAWLFSKIAQNQAEIIANEEIFPTLYESVMEGLKDDPRVACNSVSIINELAKAMKPAEDQPSNILSEVYKDLIEKCTI